MQNDLATASGINTLPVYHHPSSDRALTAEFLRGYGNRWEEAWNSHSTEEVLVLLHPDIRWNDTIFWPDVIHGRDHMRDYIEKIWKVMPDVHFKEVQLFTAPADGRAMYLFQQTAKAPPGSGSDKTATTYGCDIFMAFEDGLLSDYMAQYEITEMMRQFGTLPARDGRSGGAYLLSLNPQARRDRNQT